MQNSSTWFSPRGRKGEGLGSPIFPPRESGHSQRFVPGQLHSRYPLSLDVPRPGTHSMMGARAAEDDDDSDDPLAELLIEAAGSLSNRISRGSGDSAPLARGSHVHSVTQLAFFEPMAYSNHKGTRLIRGRATLISEPPVKQEQNNRELNNAPPLAREVGSMAAGAERIQAVPAGVFAARMVETSRTETTATTSGQEAPHPGKSFARPTATNGSTPANSDRADSPPTVLPEASSSSMEGRQRHPTPEPQPIPDRLSGMGSSSALADPIGEGIAQVRASTTSTALRTFTLRPNDQPAQSQSQLMEPFQPIHVAAIPWEPSFPVSGQVAPGQPPQLFPSNPALASAERGLVPHPISQDGGSLTSSTFSLPLGTLPNPNTDRRQGTLHLEGAYPLKEQPTTTKPMTYRVRLLNCSTDEAQIALHAAETFRPKRRTCSNPTCCREGEFRCFCPYCGKRL
jgi:hypothetical protein